MGLVEVKEAFISAGGIVLLEEPFSLPVRHFAHCLFGFQGTSCDLSGGERYVVS